MTDEELLQRAFNGETIGNGHRQRELLIGQIKNLTWAVDNLALLVRRLSRNHQNEKLVEQAMGFIKKNGLEGSILRESVPLSTALEGLEVTTNEDRLRPVDKTLGSEMRRLRRLNNLTLVDASRVSGVSLVEMSQIESGSLRPIDDTLGILARVYGADKDELIEVANMSEANIHQLAKKIAEDSRKSRRLQR